MNNELSYALPTKMGIKNANAIIDATTRDEPGLHARVVQYGTFDNTEYDDPTKLPHRILIDDVSACVHRAVEGWKLARGSNADRSNETDRTYELKTDRLTLEDLPYSDAEISRIIGSMTNDIVADFANTFFSAVYLVLDGQAPDAKIRCQAFSEERIAYIMNELTMLYETCDVDAANRFGALMQFFEKKKMTKDMDEIIARLFLRMSAMNCTGWREKVIAYIKKCTTIHFAETIFANVQEVYAMSEDISKIWISTILHLIRGYYPAPSLKIIKRYCSEVRFVYDSFRSNWNLYDNGDLLVQPTEFIGKLSIVQSVTEADFDIAKISHEWHKRGPKYRAVIRSPDTDQLVIGAGVLKWKDVARGGYRSSGQDRNVFMEAWWNAMVLKYAQHSKPKSERPIQQIVHSIIKLLVSGGTDYTDSDAIIKPAEALRSLKSGDLTSLSIDERIMKVWQPFIDMRVQLMEVRFANRLPAWIDYWNQPEVDMDDIFPVCTGSRMASIIQASQASASTDDAPS